MRCGPTRRWGRTSTAVRCSGRKLIFLAYAEHRFLQVKPGLEAKATKRNPVTPEKYKAKSVFYMPEEAQLSHLVELPENVDLGEAVDVVMTAIELHNPELDGVLPRGYRRLE